MQPDNSLRFMGPATFMRTPMVTDPSEVDIALIGIPYDGGVTNRPGARHGPREIRNASSLTRTIHHVTRVNPYQICRIADLGDVPMDSIYSIEETNDIICKFFKSVHSAGTIPLSAGGDHSVTYPILRAIAADRPVALIHIDAHTDTWGPFQGSKFHHGSPFYWACEEGLILPENTIQIGIRGAQNTSEGWDYSAEKGMRVVFMEEFAEIGVDAVIDEARKIVGNIPTYISFDVDGLDPVYAPGTGTPEIGGITTLEAQKFLRGLSGLNLIGADVVEVAPPFDQTGNTAMVGATLMYEMLCLLAEARNSRNT